LKTKFAMNSIFKKLVGGGSGNAPVANAATPVWPLAPSGFSQAQLQNNAAANQIRPCTPQMLEGEAFQIPFTVAEDLWRAAFGDSWVGVDSLNDFHCGVACRLMFRNRMEKVIVDYEERVRIVE